MAYRAPTTCPPGSFLREDPAWAPKLKTALEEGVGRKHSHASADLALRREAAADQAGVHGPAAVPVTKCR